MRKPDAPGDGLSPRAAYVTELARQHLGHMSERQREAIFNAVRSKLPDRQRAHVLGRSVGAVAALGSCAALAGALFAHFHTRSQPMSFRVEGGDLRAGGEVQAGPSERPVLHFSDGSEVAMGEGSRLQVRSIDAHGADVALDEGQAHAYVTHSPATRWRFDAGPFVVAVTGTAFGISWIVDEDRLDVRLENGTVTVSGPVFDLPVALRAGQWLTVRAREVLIRDIASTEADAKQEPAERGQDPEPESTANAEPSFNVSAPKRIRRHLALPVLAKPDRHWPKELADGNFGAIVDDAMGMGLNAALFETSSDDLAALADAARYTRRNDVARSAFLSQRRRFATSEHARVAAFSLGRLSEAEQDVSGALSWFEAYLVEAPAGVYASEALGRKMLLVQHLDGNDAARSLADAYMRRFPNGTYAKTARALAMAPEQ